MFCISQIDNNMDEKIIKLLNSEKDFLISVSEILPSGLNINLTDKLTLDDITLKNRFKKGHYLLISDKEIKLVHKFENLNRIGFLNTKKFIVDTLFTWKLLPFECNYPNIESNDSSMDFELSNSNSGFDSEEIISNFSKHKLDNIHANIIIEKCNSFDYSSEEEINIIPQPIFNNVYKDDKTDKSIEFNEFTLDTKPSTICMIAKRGSGKSWLASNIINNLNTTPNFIENTLIISPTEQMIQFYGPIFPKSQILYNYDSDVLTDYLKKIENLNSEEFKKFSGCVVLDDCLSSNKQFQKDPVIMELLCNAKHYNLTVVLILQWPMPMLAEIRLRFDYIFLFKEDFLIIQKKLYGQYASMFPNLEIFKKIFEQLTQNYHCMVIKNRCINPNFLDKIFYFKAESPN